MHTSIVSHEQWFGDFARSFWEAEKIDAAPLLLKEEHTRAVLEHARLLAAEEALAPLPARACLLAALYHDVARFPQYARWRTFKDDLSANHGLWGAKILKKHRRLEGEDPQVRRTVMAAVGMHNRFRVPHGIPEDARLVTDVVRDADKQDILRIMADHLERPQLNGAVVLHVKDEPDKWSPKVLEDVLAGRVASYADLRYINDFRLLLGTWLHDVRFAATLRKLAASGLIPRLLAPLPDVSPVREARASLLRRLEAAR